MKRNDKDMKCISKQFLRGSFDEYTKHVKSGVVYDFTDNGKCSNCGSCCTCNLALTEQEVAIIKRYIKQHNIKPKKTIFPTNEPVLDMTCPFLDETVKTHKCQIYEVRPTICRWFKCDKPKDYTELIRNQDFMKNAKHYPNINKVFYP